MAIYYIDLNAGDDTKDGLSITNAWKTIGKFAASARNAGDTAKVRANTTEAVAATIVVSSSGVAGNPITLKGCNSVDDPWGDASSVRPILNFQSADRHFSLGSRNYWRLENLEFANSTSESISTTQIGAIRLQSSKGNQIINCKLNSNARGICSYTANNYLIKDCVFLNNTYGISFRGSFGSDYPIRNCTFDGDTYGIYLWCAVPLKLINCSFGQSVAIVTGDIRLEVSANQSTYYRIEARNCKWDKGLSFGTGAEQGYSLFCEDDGGVFGAHKSVGYYLQRERVTDIVRGGGASSSLKTSFKTGGPDLGHNLLVSCSLDSILGLSKVWLSADIQKTITIYVRGYGWDPYPDATTLFVRASYLSNGASAARTEIDSSEVITNNNDWVAFTVTMTPARDGFVYLDVFLGKYKADSGIYVDIKPVVS